MPIKWVNDVFLFLFRMLSLHEMGVLRYLERRYFKSEGTCGADLRADSSSLAINDVWPAFVVLAIGLTASVVCFILEMPRALHNYQHRSDY